MTITRRRFVKGGLISAAALTFRGCGNDVHAAPIVDATVDVTPGPSYGLIRVTPAAYPALVAIGGAVTLRLAPVLQTPTDFRIPPHGVLLIHRGAPGDDPEYVATRSDCPHQGCPLGYSAKDELIECPCHASKFLAVTDPDDEARCAGLPVHRPAVATLAVYRANVKDGVVSVDLRTDLSCTSLGGIPAVIDGKVSIPIAMFPALGAIGGSLVGTPSGGNGDTLIVARISQTEVIVLSDICTHSQCPVTFDTPGNQFHCHCHDSFFDYTANVTGGPAPAPLRKYDATFANDVITITIT